MSKEAPATEIEKLIKSWQEEFPKEKYIVRGHSKIYGEEPGEKKISSTLYRQAKKEKRRAITAQELLDEERELAASTRMRSLPLIKDAEILSDLQHFGAPTNCIDFTRDIYIALFFACVDDENRREPGELVFLRHDEMPLTLPQHFELPTMALAVPWIELLVPSTTGIDQNRSLFQRSLFVRHRRGAFNVPGSLVKRIDPDKKRLFRTTLSKHNVSHHSLFNDTFGLINLGTRPVQGNWLDSIKMFSTDWDSNNLQSIMQQGIIDYCNANYQKAVQRFDRVMLHNSSDKGRRLRASAHLCRGYYGKALEDISNVSEAAWNDRDYFLMAIAFYKLGDFDHSFRAINKAIGCNSYRTIYHHFRIMLRKSRSEKPSAKPNHLKYLDDFIEDPAVSRIVSEKIINTEQSYGDRDERAWLKSHRRLGCKTKPRISSCK